MKVFGPVPLHRLGKSIGVNDIPHKDCTYSFIYCQVGKAVRMQLERQVFYLPDELFSEDAVKGLLEKSGKDFDGVNRLIEKGFLPKTVFRGKNYYVRRFVR